MAYGLKYYKLIQDAHLSSGGRATLQLDIFEKDYTGTSKEIDALTSLVLEADCQDATSAIQKTILKIGLSDRPDIEDTDTRKYGSWEEFYTPDSTKFKVTISIANSVRWSGYITPDDWSESLDYHASVNITARDNIGHLEDFDFEPTSGLMSVHDIIQSAFALIEPPYSITYDYNGDYTLETEDGTSIARAKINTSLYKGKTWYDVLDSVLTSLGMCVRYVGNNTYLVGFLRYSTMYAGGIKAEPYFRGSATLTLTPAYKSIVEEDKYDFADLETPDYQTPVLENSNSKEVTYSQETLGSTTTKTTTVTYASIYTEEPGWSSNIHCIDDGINTDGKFDRFKGALVPLSSITTFNFGSIHNIPVQIKFSTILGAFSVVGDKRLDLLIADRVNVLISIYRKYTNDSGDTVTRYLNVANNQWQDTSVYKTLTLAASNKDQLEQSIYVPIDSSTSEGGSLHLQFYFSGITVGFTSQLGANYMGIYLPIEEVGISADENFKYKKIETNKVTTVNDERFNMTKKLTPDIFALSHDDVTIVNNTTYENVLWLNQLTPFPYNVRWRKDGGDCKPLPALLAMQQLCYGIRPMAKIAAQRKCPSDGFHRPYNRGSERLTPLDYRFDYLREELTETSYEWMEFQNAFLQYEVILTSVGDLAKLEAAKAVRDIANVTLIEAKDYVESILAGTPTTVATVTGQSTANAMLQSFTDLGFTGSINQI